MNAEQSQAYERLNKINDLLHNYKVEPEVLRPVLELLKLVKETLLFGTLPESIHEKGALQIAAALIHHEDTRSIDIGMIAKRAAFISKQVIKEVQQDV